jgi:dTDP-4-amino-4,6-dideoxygalactose transaminase
MITLHAPFEHIVGDWQRIAKSGQFTEGKYVHALEDRLSAFYRQEAVALNSCGSALFAAASILGPGRAIVPSNTFYATGAMMKEAGWEIVLADCGWEGFSLTPQTILEAAERDGGKIDAVVLTHVGGGLAPEYAAIAALCDARGWTLLEDAAHCLAVRDNQGHAAGDLGTAACFSFYPTKAIPAGDGGALVTKNKALACAVEEFRNYGKRVVDGKITYRRGFNLRMDEWTAAVAVHQFQHWPVIFEARRRVADMLWKVCPPLFDWGGATCWYKYPVQADFPSVKQAGKIYQRTDQLAHIYGDTGSYPVSERIADTHICLPLDETIYAGWSSGQIEQFLLTGHQHGWKDN